MSSDERLAMSRYIATLRKQLQELTDLFGKRYGRDSTLCNLSAKALVCMTLTEHELQNEAEQASTYLPDSSSEPDGEHSGILRIVR